MEKIQQNFHQFEEQNLDTCMYLGLQTIIFENIKEKTNSLFSDVCVFSSLCFSELESNFRKEKSLYFYHPDLRGPHVCFCV